MNECIYLFIYKCQIKDLLTYLEHGWQLKHCIVIYIQSALNIYIYIYSHIHIHTDRQTYKAYVI